MKNSTPKTATSPEVIPAFFDFHQSDLKFYSDKVFVKNWWIMDGDFVNYEEPICTIKLLYRGNFEEQYVFPTAPGYVQRLLKPGERLAEGTPVALIHPPGSYSKENSPSNATFKFHFVPFRYNHPVKGSRRVKPQFTPYPPETNCFCEWKKEDGLWVEKGDVVLTLTRFFLPSCHFNFKGDPLDHLAEKSGYLYSVQTKQSGFFLTPGKLIYRIQDNVEPSRLP